MIDYIFTLLKQLFFLFIEVVNSFELLSFMDEEILI